MLRRRGLCSTAVVNAVFWENPNPTPSPTVVGYSVLGCCGLCGAAVVNAELWEGARTIPFSRLKPVNMYWLGAPTTPKFHEMWNAALNAHETAVQQRNSVFLLVSFSGRFCFAAQLVRDVTLSGLLDKVMVTGAILSPPWFKARLHFYRT